jgi:nanoRNase/pAp phosphatase (c-di-AMP/oligoRNAs hydrolase)
MLAVKATLVVRQRIVHVEELFAEVVVWVVPKSLAGCVHCYKYRLAFVAHGECVLRYDNEAGKGGHRHAGGAEGGYRFSTLDRLFADFQRDIRRYLDEDHHP